MAFLDPRDFRPTLRFFRSVNSLNLLSVPDMELDFLPLVPLLPIREPLQATTLTLNQQPRMESFDVDYNTNRVLLHFTDYMNLATFDPTQLVLTNPRNGIVHVLSNNSIPSDFDDQLVRTICITLNSADVETLQNMSICSTMPDECACYFSTVLVMSHSNVSVLGVPSTLPLPVSNYIVRIVTSHLFLLPGF